MKKNRMMRLASVLLVLVLLTTSVISGTFAKYTTSVTSNDKARVAYWGFQSSNSMDITGLFSDTYTNVDSVNGADVIAPGTEGKATFQFAWDEVTTEWNGATVNVTGPEVAYTFKVEVEETIDTLIENNKNIKWALVKGNVEVSAITDTEWNTWDNMVAEIKALSGEADGEKEYEPNKLPDAFTKDDDTYTIAWKWVFDGGTAKYDHDDNDETAELDQDQYDTYMGNAELLDDCSIKITITATQVN